ncbi:universal stress protein [Arenibaculum pallidiluteum]|uniref:universal stress protein n=1 Tax=Arenibaculum pallidiluteum TaxID=2812559 RepID=UPI001A969EC5|nr:universal stress protein [Arenibaculum pallidiluteum]
MKKILVPLLGRQSDRRAVAAGFAAARRFGAHVQGLAVANPAGMHADIEGGMPASLVETLRRVQREEWRRSIDEARALFDGISANSPALSVGWTEAVGSTAEIVTEEGRLADLLVFAQSTEPSEVVQEIVESALFGSGRAVLMASGAVPGTIGAKVAVAWDGGSSASRAVCVAMPILRQAESVDIICVDPVGSSRSASPGLLAEYLALHGIQSTAVHTAAASRPISRALTDTAVDHGCDLLVMGAYGHSRLRELVLGGVTRDLLGATPDLPVLMAH